MIKIHEQLTIKHVVKLIKALPAFTLQKRNDWPVANTWDCNSVRKRTMYVAWW